MEQASSVVMSMLQTMTSQTTGIPKTAGASEDGERSDFQKLLEEKSQEKDPLVEERPKTEAPAAKKTDKAPVQKQENPLEQVKKLAEQGYVVTQPPIANYNLETGEVLQPGEYVQAWMGEHVEIIPVTDVDPQELAQLMADVGPAQVIDVSDPLADAMLEATAPGADNSPAALLEKVVNEEVGETVQQVVKEVQPKEQQEDDDDGEVNVTDFEQAPQRIFHDVQAAPVKVGEVYDAQQTEEPNVVEQVDVQLAQALQHGDSMVRIQLTPENLGEVTVEISQNADGVLHVALTAHNDSTRGLLERHAGELQGLLSSRGPQEVHVEVQRQSESQQNQNQQQRNYDGHNGHAQDGQERRRQQREHTSSQDFMQQLRLGLIPIDGEF